MKNLFKSIEFSCFRNLRHPFINRFKKGCIAIVVLLFFSSSVIGSTFTCQPPTAGGIFTIGLKSFTDNCAPIKVNIPAGSTAAQKATLIAAKINASCAGVFTATATGDQVEVLNSVHPGQRVFFKFGPDATGEKDKIEDDLQPGWWDWFWGATAPLYTCSSSASGVSVNGTGPGKIYIGTSTCVATVLTTPGMSPFAILNNARTQLLTWGLTEVNLAEVSPGVWGLSFRGQPTDTFVEFGDDDSGAECVFEMFEPPVSQFRQLNFSYDGTITTNSAWGVADVAFIGTDQIMYLNLTIGTTWAIQNMPVLSTRGTGIQQTQRFWFDLGTSGIPVSLLTHSLTITPTIFGQPSNLSTSPVSADWVRINTGLVGGGPGGGPGPAGPQVGGLAANPNPKMHKNFPNQESPPNFCVPTGVSNSLQWLNAQNGLGMKPADISIPALANAFGTTPANGTVKNTIYRNKKKYCKAKKLPITTRKFKGSQIGDVAKEIKNGQDVELMVDWIGGGGKGHCVAVTGITDHGNGKYSLVITHDKDQTQPGGTVDENATYNKNTSTWGGALSKAVGASNNVMFIVECPVVKSKQTTNNLPGGTSHKIVQDARISYGDDQYQITNLSLGGYSNNVPPPPLGSFTVLPFTSMATFDFSVDFGLTFQQNTAPCQMLMRVDHTLDSAGLMYFETEIISLSLQGGTLPPGVMLRESIDPTALSTGLLRMKEVPGGFQIDSFFDIWTELSFNGGSAWTPDDNETTVFHASGPTVLPDILLSNMIIDPSQPQCFDATGTIIVGGEGPFLVPPGGNVTLIAGQSIHFHEGVTVSPGGTLHGYITENGQYCPDPPQPPLENPGTLTGEQEIVKEIGSTPFVRVYPNPAHQSFTVELTVNDPTEITSVEIFDMSGVRVESMKMRGERKHEFSLKGMNAGIYFIHVITGNHAETVKLVKL
ncbi:MAG: T9SS type A sorting domain-containing protein [Bacteroidales bacterium]|nr:T9SS type A sorting domain-containing protein [Bacteroidales bacterium]